MIIVIQFRKRFVQTPYQLILSMTRFFSHLQPLHRKNLINLKKSDSIAAVAKVMKDEDAVDEIDIMDIEVNQEDGTISGNETDNNKEE